MFYNGLRGEEELVIEYKDFFSASLTHRFFVYAISNLERDGGQTDSGVNYVLHFISKEGFYTERTSIRRSFKNGTISEYAESIFDKSNALDKHSQASTNYC